MKTRVDEQKLIEGSLKILEDWNISDIVIDIEYSAVYDAPTRIAIKKVYKSDRDKEAKK